MTGRAIVLRGDAAHLPLPDASADLIVTSPPYRGLRAYTDGGEIYDGQIGTEATPLEYLEALWLCTREWVRVLKPEGSLFVNLGDHYSQRTQVRRSAHQPGIFPGKFEEFAESWAARAAKGAVRMPHQNVINNDGGFVAEKSLLNLPHRYAIGCTDRLGLIQRAEIIWDKPSGMPESVKDRVRRSHEQVFHFTKSPRYFAAVDEIREPHQPQSLARSRRNRFAPDRSQAGVGSPDTQDPGQSCHPLGKLPGSVWEIPPVPLIVPERLGISHFAAFPPELVRRIILGWSPSGICTACGQGQHPVTCCRSTESQRDSYATASWTAGSGALRDGQSDGLRLRSRRTEATIIGYACACTPFTDHEGSGKTARRRDCNPGQPGYNPQGTYGRKQAGEYERVGPWREYHLEDWTPPPARPALVVDPFAGTGTSMLVAAAYGRIGIGVDRSADYCRLAQWRTSDPGERARALGVPKPPPVIDGQVSLFDLEAS